MVHPAKFTVTTTSSQDYLPYIIIKSTMDWSIKAFIYADGSFLFRELWGYFLACSSSPKLLIEANQY